MSRVLKAALGVVLAVLVGALTTEALVRALAPTPRSQVIRGVADDGTPAFRVLDGQPIWADADPSGRAEPPCGPQARDVVVFGTSILYGIGVPPERTWSRLVQQRLDPTHERWCVRNLAQPAFVGGQMLALAKEQLPRLKPAVVVWEVWGFNVGERYTLLDGDAYNLSNRALDAGGHPRWAPVPASLNGALFRHSAAWRFAALALAPVDLKSEPELAEAAIADVLEPARALAEAHGARLLLAAQTPLDRPFRESADQLAATWYPSMKAWADARALPWVDVADELADEDVEALRRDPCCHYAEPGHEALARVLGPRIEALLPTP